MKQLFWPFYFFFGGGGAFFWDEICVKKGVGLIIEESISATVILRIKIISLQLFIFVWFLTIAGGQATHPQYGVLITVLIDELLNRSYTGSGRIRTIDFAL